MSSNSHKNPEDQEVDLEMVSKKIKGIFQSVNDLIFDCIQFLVKNKYTILALFIIGVALGIYLDRTNKNYDHQIVVAPNFGSTDYLYDKVDLLESKIKERDTVFLKAIGIEDASKLTNIEIKPVLDIYQFINNNNEKNFELLKLMSEDNDIKKIVEEKTTSKNYKYHIIYFSTKDRTTDKKTFAPLLKYLNNSSFYIKIQKESVNNVYLKIKSNDLIIAQIDGFLNGIAIGTGSKEGKLVYYNENSPLKDVIDTKDRLVQEQGNLRVTLVSMDKIIKDVSQISNIESSSATNGKKKLILPFVFIGLFVLISIFINFYKAQSLKRKQQ